MAYPQQPEHDDMLLCGGEHIRDRKAGGEDYDMTPSSIFNESLPSDDTELQNPERSMSPAMRMLVEKYLKFMDPTTLLNLIHINHKEIMAETPKRNQGLEP